MFDNLSEKLDKALHVLKGHGQITEINVAETLKEIVEPYSMLTLTLKLLRNLLIE